MFDGHDLPPSYSPDGASYLFAQGRFEEGHKELQKVREALLSDQPSDEADDVITQIRLHMVGAVGTFAAAQHAALAFGEADFDDPIARTRTLGILEGTEAQLLHQLRFADKRPYQPPYERETRAGQGEICSYLGRISTGKLVVDFTDQVHKIAPEGQVYFNQAHTHLAKSGDIPALGRNAVYAARHAHIIGDEAMVQMWLERAVAASNTLTEAGVLGPRQIFEARVAAGLVNTPVPGSTAIMNTVLTHL